MPRCAHQRAQQPAESKGSNEFNRSGRGQGAPAASPGVGPTAVAPSFKNAGQADSCESALQGSVTAGSNCAGVDFVRDGGQPRAFLHASRLGYARHSGVKIFANCRRGFGRRGSAGDVLGPLRVGFPIYPTRYPALRHGGLRWQFRSGSLQLDLGLGSWRRATPGASVTGQRHFKRSETSWHLGASLAHRAAGYQTAALGISLELRLQAGLPGTCCTAAAGGLR